MRELIEIIDNRVDLLKQKIRTSIPAVVLEYDDEENEVKLELKVKMKDAESSPIVACKVHFPGDHDYVVATSIRAGTTGMAMFSNVAIKNWFETGEMQYSKFEFSDDAVWFIPGINPDEQHINAPTEGIRLQNRAGSRYAWLKDDSFECNVPARFTEEVIMTKGFEAKKKAVLDGKNLTKVSHTHKFTNADGALSKTEDADE
ncbi:Gp138 family membrane-puncturing spike protein [Vibrio parahaemolyticus]